MLDVWTILTLIFSFMMAFSIGSNDAANGLGTSYGTKAIPMWAIIMNGAIAEFVGAMFCSNKVSATLTEDVIENINELSDTTKQRMMFAVCVASFLFIMTSSFSGMPISGTHTVVGAMLGTGVVGSSWGNLNWKKFGTIVASWVVSPLLSAIFAFILMTLVSALTLNTMKYSFKARILYLQFIIGLCIAVLTYILDKFFNRTLSLDAPSVTDSNNGHNTFGLDPTVYLAVLLAVGFVGGMMICRLLLTVICFTRQNGRLSCGFVTCTLLKAMFLLFDTATIE